MSSDVGGSVGLENGPSWSEASRETARYSDWLIRYRLRTVGLHLMYTP